MNLSQKLPPPLQARNVFIVGIKGSGITALVEVLHRAGRHIVGSDVSDTFFTDEILHQLGIEVIESFDADRLPSDTDIVIYSAAYNPATHPQLQLAQERGIPIYSYPQAAGMISEHIPTVCVAGMHGKTTITAMIGILARALKFPALVMGGSAVRDFDGRLTWAGGNQWFVVETCEYRRHFLNFRPSILLISSIERDHLDYYKNYDDIISAFTEYIERIVDGGTLIFCADDPGAQTVAQYAAHHRKDISQIGYGFDSSSQYRIMPTEDEYRNGDFLLIDEHSSQPTAWNMPIPGLHSIQNGAGAIAAIQSIYSHSDGGTPSDIYEKMNKALHKFAGCRRRFEILGEPQGILIIDDYGHHPTEIRTTLRGLRIRYPQRRLIVDFMSHTYTRTAQLLDEFAHAFEDADILFLHKIYASARENFDGTINGKMLADAISAHHSATYFIEEPLNAVKKCLQLLQFNDIFVTMGAGDNWILGRAIYDILKIKRECK